jgi:hypothetical protein
MDHAPGRWTVAEEFLATLPEIAEDTPRGKERMVALRRWLTELRPHVEYLAPDRATAFIIEEAHGMCDADDGPEIEEMVHDTFTPTTLRDADDGPPNDGWQGPTEIPAGADAGRDPPPVAFTFDLAPYAFPDPASIPAREWLFGRHYIRGAVSATIGAPGRLKSTTVLTEMIGMAVGRDLMTGEALASGPLRAAYLNGEEVQDELDRRVAAICQHFGLKPQDCGGRLWVRSTRDRPIRVAVRNPRGDAMVQGDVVTALTDWCDQRQIDAIGIDPLISFHAVRESDNGDMDLVCKEAFGAIAGKTRAVDLVHHPRKLAPGESNATVDQPMKHQERHSPASSFRDKIRRLLQSRYRRRSEKRR